MKKKMTALFFVVLMCFSTIVSAAGQTYGSLLDTENAIVQKFLFADNYQNISDDMSAEMKEVFTPEKFKEFKDQTTADLGRVDESQLMLVKKFPNVDQLIYLAKFSKGEVGQIVAAFDISGPKPLLLEFGLWMPDEEKAAEKK